MQIKTDYAIKSETWCGLNKPEMDEKDADDVIFFICRMKDKGAETMEKTVEGVKRKKVYADQVDWY